MTTPSGRRIGRTKRSNGSRTIRSPIRSSACLRSYSATRKRAADHYVTAGKLNPRSSRSTALLKGLRKKAPIGIFVTFILIRVISVPLRGRSEVIQVIGVGVVIALLVLLFVAWPRWNARRAMSDEARQVLARDRELRQR